MITRRAALLAAAAQPFAAAFASAAAPLRVVASFTILQDMVRRIAGSAADVASLVPPDGDPHEFEPKPSDLAGLAGAGAIVENGLGLEGWLSRTVQSSGFRGTRIVASTGIAPRRLEEDGKPVSDPHIWQNPLLGVRMVGTIAEGLARARPADADALRAAAASYQDELHRVDADIAAAWAPIPAARRKVLTTHDAFGYYGARYGVTFIALQGVSTDAEPSARGLARAAHQARSERIGIVFLENMTDPRLAEALAREAGLKVGPKLYADSLSPPGGPAPTYLDLLRFNTAELVRSMS